MHKNGLTKNEIKRQLQMDVRTIEKYISLGEDSEDLKDKDAPLKEHEAAVSKKAANIAKVRKMHEQNYSARAPDFYR